jgi:hypothetical protein
MTEPVALEQLASSARDALARNDVKAAERADAALAALPYLPAGLSVLRVDVARLRRSREAVRDLTHHALMQWFDGAATSAPTTSGHMRGPAQIDRLAERADLVHHLARQVLMAPGSFDQSAQPSFYGLRGGCVLPRADWAPVTPAGLVLARGMAADAREMARVLGGEPTTGNAGLSLDDPIETHGDRRIIVIGGSDNWYHFILDYLPRLLAVAECGLLECGWSVGLGHGKADLFAPVLETLGIGKASILWLAEDRAHFFPRALYISNFNLEAVPHPHALALLRQFLQPKLPAPESGGAKRLFVSRAGIGRRRLLNEAALEAGLAERGFSIIHPEKLSLAEQAALFRDAELVVGVHGSALTNLVWCRDLKAVLELASSPSGISWRNTDPHFSVLARVLGASHRRLRASEKETVTPGDHMSDFTLDPDAVLSKIDALVQEIES